jgi:hypothetical protein
MRRIVASSKGNELWCGIRRELVRLSEEKVGVVSDGEDDGRGMDRKCERYGRRLESHPGDEKANGMGAAVACDEFDLGGEGLPN